MDPQTDPQTHVKNYAFLMNEGKKLGLQGPDLTSFITSGMPSKTMAASVDPLNESLGKAIERSLDPIEREKELQRTLRYQNEQIKEAGKYKMLFGIPETISQAFGNQATMNVLGARSITDAYNAALQAYPNTQFATTAYNPRSYFS